MREGKNKGTSDCSAPEAELGFFTNGASENSVYQHLWVTSGHLRSAAWVMRKLLLWKEKPHTDGLTDRRSKIFLYSSCDLSFGHSRAAESSFWLSINILHWDLSLVDTAYHPAAWCNHHDHYLQAAFIRLLHAHAKWGVVHTRPTARISWKILPMSSIKPEVILGQGVLKLLE